MHASVAATITGHPFFQGMTPEHLKIVLGVASAGSFETGEFLFHEGDPAAQCYLVESGSISLEAHDPGGGVTVIQQVGPGEVLGWSFLFPPFVWHFQARALERTEVVVLNGAHLLIAAEGDPAFGYDLMKRVAQLVICRLQHTRARLLELAPHGVPAHAH